MTTEGSTEVLRRGHLLGIFFISASALLLEVCLSRLLAVALWYHFAFMIISGGLLGFGAAAVVVSLSRRLREEPLDKHLRGFSILMVFAIPGCWSLSQMIPLRPFSISESPVQVLYMAAVYLLLTTPFFIAGLVVSLMLSRLSRSATVLYAADLLGAGVGAVLALGLLGWVGAPGTLMISAALAAAAAVCLLWGVKSKAPYQAVVLCGVFLFFSTVADSCLPLRISENKGLGRITAALEGQEGAPEVITRWSAIGRVDVVPGRRGEPTILIDGGAAATRVPRIPGRVERFQPPPEGMDAALSVAPDHPAVLIIGAGGGYEVASALALGARRVIAVEMNDAIVELDRGELAEITGGLFQDERVELVTDEGRSFVRRAGEPVDVIACVHTISNAAWASGALSLAENYTLTVEALDDFLGRLSPSGVLWLTRPEAQLPRLMATARAALERRGVEGAEVERHLIAYRMPAQGRSFLGGLIVSRRPMSADQVTEALGLLTQDRLAPLVVPGRPPRGIDAPAFRAVLSADPPSGYRRDLGELRPCTDEQPYFNQRLPWTELRMSHVLAVLGRGQTGRMAMEDAPVAEVAVLIVLCWACLFAAILVAVPLLLWRRRQRSDGEGVLDQRSMAAMVLYFIALGLGYITVEVCLIQRLGLFVGRPEYALAVVLGAMLVSSGAGSLVATRWGSRARRAALPVLLVAAILIVAHAELGPAVTRALLGLSLVSRMLVAALLVAPVGFVLGMPLPLGLRAGPSGSPHLLAWVFGLNCAASVVGSSLCVILSSSLGFAGTLLAAAAVYLVAALATRLWRADPGEASS